MDKNNFQLFVIHGEDPLDNFHIFEVGTSEILYF